KLEELLTREEELARGLGNLLGRPLAAAGWTDLRTVRQALPPDSVLVEISRFDFEDFRLPLTKRYQGPHFAAWVITPAGKGDVRLVSLGKAQPIEEAVTAVRRDLKEAPQLIKKVGEPDAEKVIKASLRELARLIY